MNSGLYSRCDVMVLMQVVTRFYTNTRRRRDNHENKVYSININDAHNEDVVAHIFIQL